MPFDFHNDDHPEGLASARVRMMQPYAGKGRGMQFPMAKGTEVLLTFVDGDPDRPLIAGAINTAAAPGPVTANNQTESVIQTGGNNKIRMEDKAGSERILLETPSAGSWIRVGAPNDPVISIEDHNAGDGIRVQSANGNLWFETGFGFGDYHGGVKPAAVAIPPSTDPHPAPNQIQNLIDKFSGASPSYNPSGIRDFSDNGFADPNAGPEFDAALLASGYTEEKFDQAASDFNDATITRDQKQAYYDGLPSNSSYDSPEDYQNALEAINAAQVNVDAKQAIYNPLFDADKKKKAASDSSMLNDIINTDRVHLRVSQMDTITTQEGNIYDFGGYWNYNLGNSYAEEHINQSAKLNYSYPLKVGADDAVSSYQTWVPTLIAAGVPVVAAIAVAGAIGKGGKIGAPIAAGLFAAIMGLLPMVLKQNENFETQSPEETDLKDVIGGPGSGDINGPAGKVKSSFKHTMVDGKLVLTKPEVQDFKDHAPMHMDTTWVTKQFGDNYEYSIGNTISISKGNTEEHSKGDSYEYSYGGRSEETKYTGDGIKTHTSWSASGESGEANYNRNTGQLTQISYKDRRDMFLDVEMTLPDTPTFSGSLNIASLATKVAFTTGMNIDLGVSVGMSISGKISAGFAIELEANPAWKLELDDGSMKFKGPGTKFDKKAELDGKLQTLMLDDAKMCLKKQGMTIEETAASVKSGKIDLNETKLFCIL
jgi:hypothetical protein